jgi:predicted ATP-binding protein involved in virulence
MVDEIDLHLHPQWQTTLVRKLRAAFPKIQFIFTIHSPTILQGANEDAVFFRVYRDGQSGETKVSEPFFKKDMNHMMFNTLMTSPLFGLESARLSPDAQVPDTNDSYLDRRVEEAVKRRLAEQKKAGKKFISPQAIDALIEEVLTSEIKG